MSQLRVNPVTEILVKHALAERLLAEIVNGRLAPGARIVEGTWGRKLGVAQASIREAINILSQEGFVTKASGRSARVVNLSEQDVLEIYQLRGAIEGLAARLAADKGADPVRMQEAVDAMHRATQAGQPGALLDADRQFHLELCEASGNPHLLLHARRILIPFFAFVRMRVVTSGQNSSPWGRDLDAHQRIIDLVREKEGDVAEHYVRRLMIRFSENAYQNWEKKPTTPTKPAKS